MPSKSPAQARLMRAVEHGWKPDKIKGPSKKVAKEFVRADEAKKRKHRLDSWARGRSKSPK